MLSKINIFRVNSAGRRRLNREGNRQRGTGHLLNALDRRPPARGSRATRPAHPAGVAGRDGSGPECRQPATPEPSRKERPSSSSPVAVLFVCLARARSEVASKSARAPLKDSRPLLIIVCFGLQLDRPVDILDAASSREAAKLAHPPFWREAARTPRGGFWVSRTRSSMAASV